MSTLTPVDTRALAQGPHAAPGGLRADTAACPRRACPHLRCSKAAAFDLHSYLMLLPSWHSLARRRTQGLRPGQEDSGAGALTVYAIEKADLAAVSAGNLLGQR